MTKNEPIYHRGWRSKRDKSVYFWLGDGYLLYTCNAIIVLEN